jgi:alpha-glucosidase (family GH31 glycosyl hydrolase)
VSLAAIKKAMAVRESLHDYIMAAMDKVSQTGLPINRPLWFDFPADANTWEIKDEYHLRNMNMLIKTMDWLRFSYVL